MSRKTRADMMSELYSAQGLLSDAKRQLEVARRELADKESELVRLRDYAGKQYLAGMENQRRFAVERIESWAAETASILGPKRFIQISVAAVKIAVEEEVSKESKLSLDQ